MVNPCAAQARPSEGDELLHLRTHRVPEIVDLRAQRGNKRTKFGAAWRSERDIPKPLFHHLAADGAGQQPCVAGRADNLCTSCDADAVGSVSRLCMCATLPPPRRLMRLTHGRGALRNPLSLMTRPEFDAQIVRECCLAQRGNATWRRDV